MNLIRYILIPWLRNIRSDLRTFLINLIGMAVAVFSLIIISFWVYSEISFDKFHSNYKNIYLITWKQNHTSTLKPAWEDFEGPIMKVQFPEVINYTRFQYESEVLLQKGTDEFFTINGAAADSMVFSVFSIELIKGDKNLVLRRPEDIVISESLALKYFGRSDPMSKPMTTIKINKRIYTVAGVFRDLPSNSTLQFDFLVPNDRVEKDWWESETSFILVNNVTTIEHLKKKMVNICRQNQSYPECEVSLFPFSEIHFHSNFWLFGRIQYGSFNYVKIFLAVAFFILFIAGFNVINLTTAKIEKRSKQTGLKKILGAGRMTLYKQFLFESLSFSILVVIVALILYAIILPSLDLLPGLAKLKLNLSFVIYFIIGTILFIWLITGFYPSALFSRINPLYAMKGKAYTSASNARLRNFLVSFQFIISIFLLTSTFWVIGQIDFIRKADLGFDPKNIVVIPSFFYNAAFDKEFEAKTKKQQNDFYQRMMKLCSYAENELKRSPLILGFTYGNVIDIVPEGQFLLLGSESSEPSSLSFISLGPDFDKILDIKILKGRSFTAEEGFGQLDECIINDAAAKYFNLKEPIGEIFRDGTGYNYRIVGVTNNFHFEHISKQVAPLLIYKGRKSQPMLIKVRNKHMQEAIKFMNQLYNYKKSDIPFSYKLFENAYNKKYENDYRACWVLVFFSLVALIISCMGIYGLAGFQAESRNMEIAVRKVFGAQIRDMHTLFLLEFGRYVGISLALGWPLAYYVLREYASHFALHPAISFWPFLLSGIILSLITFITVESQIMLVCRKNTAETLKYE
jgi:putative ABC transport system permease protein